MTAEELIEHLEQYEAELSGILSRYSKKRDSIYIDRNDDPKYRQSVQELVDLFNDNLGRNQYSKCIVGIANEGVRNFTRSPSFKSEV